MSCDTHLLQVHDPLSLLSASVNSLIALEAVSRLICFKVAIIKVGKGMVQTVPQ